MRIGILGGTFNPPHLAHLAMAEKAREVLNLDKVIFMLSALPPLKEPEVPIKKRMEMLEIMIGSRPKFEVSDLEAKRAALGKKSYTIDTIYQLKKIYPQAEIYWIVGADSYQELLEGKWKEPEKVLKMINLIVFERPGYKINKFIRNSFKFVIRRRTLRKAHMFIKMGLAISSTEIRARIKKGQSVKKYLPKKVLDYIIKNRLYK